MRRFIVTVLVVCLPLFAACSYTTDFVIVNESDGPITVRYEVNDYPGPFSPPVAPGVVPASELSEDGQQWHPVQFEIDEASRSVTTRLMPGQALRIATMNHYTAHDDPNDALDYQIRRIVVSGTRGQMELTGEQARTTFTKVARTLYTLTYR
jgi:hypothetical protein